MGHLCFCFYLSSHILKKVDRPQRVEAKKRDYSEVKGDDDDIPVWPRSKICVQTGHVSRLDLLSLQMGHLHVSIFLTGK